MWWPHRIEAGVWVIGALCAGSILWNRKAREVGIGPQTIRALTISLGVPLLLTLALEKALMGETVAAVVGALLGLGIQRDKDS